MEKDDFTHVGFSLISNDYTNFVKCAKAVKDYNPSIKTIAGGPGSLSKQTIEFVDHVSIGDGVRFLRNFFNEKVDSPYKITIIPDRVILQYLGRNISSNQCKIITRIGCPFKCDFCATNVLFQGKYSGEIFTPIQVHDALVNFRDKLGKGSLQVFWAEPTSIFKLKWWYELFDLFKEDYGDFSFFVTAPSIILQKLNLDRISNSTARIGFVNVGIESFNKNYTKNYKIDIKQLVAKMNDYGISTYATYIIGFDFDKKETVWEDIKKLMNIDADMYSVLNLHPVPQTSTWNELKSKNRLLNLPPDYYQIPGFQPFTHPHFKPGFEDMFPLLCKIYKYIEVERGNMILNMASTYEKLLKYTNHPKLIRREMKIYKSIGKTIYPAWKDYFKPTKIQEENYLKKIS